MREKTLVFKVVFNYFISKNLSTWGYVLMNYFCT